MSKKLLSPRAEEWQGLANEGLLYSPQTRWSGLLSLMAGVVGPPLAGWEPVDTEFSEFLLRPK